MKSEDSIYLITRFCNGGTLQDLIDGKFPDGLDEESAVVYLRQICEGFHAMHNSGYKIMHRDLKLANIFLDDNGVVIGDFGFAKLGESKAFTELGTPYYMAPETLLKNKESDYNNKCDIWSIGVCFYKLLFGTLPFMNASSKAELLNLIVTQGINFNLKKKISPQSKLLLEKMLNKKVEQRISFEELFNHPLIKINKKGISSYSTTLSHKLSTNSKPEFNKYFNENKNVTSIMTEQNRNEYSNDNKNLNFTQHIDDTPQKSLFSNGPSIYKKQESNYSKQNLNDFSHFSVNFTSHQNTNILRYLVNYEYYKNVVIFINDTAKSFLTALNIYHLKEIKGIIAIIYLVLKKKILLTLTKVINIMSQKKNVFNLSNFDDLIKTEVYCEMLDFFNNYYMKTKNDYLDFIRNITGIISKSTFNPSLIDGYELQNADHHILEAVKHLVKYYFSKKNDWKLNENLELIRLVTLLFFCENIHSKLPMSNYSTEKDWKCLLVILMEKKIEELENNLKNVI
jgi:hypothetical protein